MAATGPEGNPTAQPVWTAVQKYDLERGTIEMRSFGPEQRRRRAAVRAAPSERGGGRRLRPRARLRPRPERQRLLRPRRAQHRAASRSRASGSRTASRTASTATGSPPPPDERTAANACVGGAVTRYLVRRAGPSCRRRAHPRAASRRARQGELMRFGLNIGYSGSQMAIDMALVQEAERAGFHSVWTAEAYGSDAVTPIAWVGGPDRAHPRRHRDHADAGAHAGDDGDDGDDARSALGRPLSPRARRLRSAGRRGLARRRLRQAARPHARVRVDRPQDLGAREAARARGRALPDPVPRPGRERARQAAQEHPPRPPDPDLHRRDRTEERRADGGDRRRLAARSGTRRIAPTSTRTRSRRASARPAAASRSRASTSRPPSPSSKAATCKRAST